MDPIFDSPEDEKFELDTDDELELEYFNAIEHDRVVSSSGSSNVNSIIIDQFVAMGFPQKMVIKAIKENGEGHEENILNTIFTYKELLKAGELDLGASSSHSLSDDNLDDISDGDSACVEEKQSKENPFDRDRTLASLLDMGYRLEDALAAMEKYGSDASVDKLIGFICAIEMAKRITSDLPESSARSQIVKRRLPAHAPLVKKRKNFNATNNDKRPLHPSVRLKSSGSIRLPNPMIGFGVPGMMPLHVSRKLPKDTIGRPYFYYENVTIAPKGVWDQISRFLFDIEPEFVDSLHFSAAARKRGYVHNLPIENRSVLLEIPPQTIHEALPATKKWWPKWDKRTKLNCLLTCIGSAQLTNRIRTRMVQGNGDPPESDKKYIINQCKKWNLVWVGKHRVAVLDPEEMERLMGFPLGHTRGLGQTERYKVLGNSFQVHTVAYHLSVLKPMFPEGVNVLSLFSGIGGAEIALHKLGIPLKNVVSVEISPSCTQILEDWWNHTNQKGKLIHVDDIQEVHNYMIDRWIKEFDGFDLIIGGSPCNNLSGGNRRTRVGLEGEHSSLFFHYHRILERVREVMRMRMRMR